MKQLLHEAFERYSEELKSFLRRRGHDRESAADLAQDTFVRVLQAADDLNVSNPQAYLHQVARNLSIDTSRREMRRCPLVFGANDIVDIADPTPSPEVIVSDRQQLRLALDVLDKMPERTRFAFEAHRLGEKTLVEIAEELNLSTTRTWCLIRQGYEELRYQLKEAEE
ncbi:sigma-70 family RNA polymerase sigma factor [Agrobacterium sp. S2]|nr:sigma-70 family RNA polymerase sigma factor [Agrobacterium sp. S2]